MESVIEGHSNETISLAVDGLVWNGTSAANNQNILYIAVEYIKDNEFKIESDTSLSPQNVYNELEQHVSPLDPNMSSVAQYSPVYTSDSPVSYSNPIVVTQLVTNNNNNNNNDEAVAPLSLQNNSAEMGQVVSTKYLQMINDQAANEPPLQTPAIPQNIDSEQEVELLITDQNTGISYSVSTQEYLVERCLADDPHLLENLSTETLLDSDLLALDENTLKSSLSEIIVDPRSQKTQANSAQSPLDNIKHESSELAEIRRSSRNISCDDIEIEEKFLSQVQSIIDKPVPTRAWATLPESFLTINKLPNGDYGVFARKLINKFVQFGPLEGVYRKDDFKLEENKLELFIGVPSGPILILDTTDENASNWMCFVRRAVTYEEQNVVLIQQENSLYYITKDYINPKQELKVGYSRAYAQRYNLPVLEPTLNENNSYQCFECSEKFLTSEQLQKHLDVHDIDNVATKSRRKKKKLLKPEFIDCDNFTNFARIKQKLDALNRAGGVAKRWSCTFLECNAAFNDESLLNKHYTKAHPTIDRKNAVGDAFTCDHCSEKFASDNDLKNHISTKHTTTEKRKKCPVCYKVFASIDRVQSHMLVHGSEESKPLKCDKCNKRFLNNSALACHFKTHMLGRKQFECPICREMFDYVLQLKLHVHHHCKNGQYTCPHCEKTFFKYSIIRKHIRAFHCEKRHYCPNCSKNFPTLDKLRMHLLKHSDHREFLCADCGKQFKRKDKLKEHCKRMHSEERENAVPKQKVTNVQSSKKFIPKVQPTDYHRFIYKCHSCLVGFKRRGMLVNHLAKRHPDISPHSVPELNLPILRTTRDYYCQYCEKVYKSSSKRKAHILKNHPGSALPLSNRRHASTSDLPNPTFSQTVGSITTHPQSCQWCHKQYASKAKLLQHQRKKHLEHLQAQIDSDMKQKLNETVPTKISTEDLLAHVTPDCHLVSVESYQANDSDLRLYRLLTTTNNLAPPR